MVEIFFVLCVCVERVEKKAEKRPFRSRRSLSTPISIYSDPKVDGWTSFAFRQTARYVINPPFFFLFSLFETRFDVRTLIRKEVNSLFGRGIE